MENLGYYCGSYGLIEEMKIPMNDRACYFGDGVYDATYAANHIIYDLDEHVDRFFHSAEMINITLKLTKSELKNLLNEMVIKVDSPDQFIYWQVTRGTALRNHSFPDSDIPSNLWIMIKPGTIKDLNQKFKLITVEDTRYLHCNIKTLNLLPNVIASQKAFEAGCDEAVFHRGERVTECSHSNISIIKNNVLRTAPLDNLILPGITRGHLIHFCHDNNIPVDESPYTLDELIHADEIIITSAGALCIAVSEIDGIPVGGKAPDILNLLQHAAITKFIHDTQIK
ncbi:aminotransferase class IV [Anaerocolumna sp. AGMB13025]|uniref:aminotransferase class IV n=1 Tax=Anaerocolumna sp. AGMB13025 TaxID=3039116 RepID=UPI00241EDC1A|nr:aminotransferase class IV [Anaerocolumna sp. AGMB13025]WFR57524.1 aminotransferase class IV [Anaerocolumna sp. AGMB13025]